MSRRPEFQGPPEVYYNKEVSEKYARNTRMQEIQSQMSERAIELLQLPDKTCSLLDLGCGSGISGDVIDSYGHYWIGIDISPSMLAVGLQRDLGGDIVLGDLGQGIPFRIGVFDGVISISTMQWLCNADTSLANPITRMNILFTTLYTVLVRGAPAVFQIYPTCSKQMEMITGCALRSGFSGGVVVDNPNSTKARKYYLCLRAGVPADTKLLTTLPAPLIQSQNQSQNEDSRTTGIIKNYIRGKDKEEKRRGEKETHKAWISRKKERRKMQGKKVVRDSKYSGRKRPNFAL